MFVFITQKELKRRRLEQMKLVRILDDVDWVCGRKARVKRHERSEWARKALAEGTLFPTGNWRLPEWIAKKLDELPSDGDATLCFNLCEYRPEDVFKESDRGNPVARLAYDDQDQRPVVTIRDICKEFGKRSHGVEFSDLVRKYIKEKFNGVQARAASAAQLDPQVVNQIYNALYKSSSGKRGVEQRTVVALGLAFKLTFEEAEEFMRSAGYAFSDSVDDALLKLCFQRRFYSITDINTLLQSLQKKEIGSKFRGK